MSPEDLEKVRQWRAVNQAHARATMRLRELGQEPFILTEKDKTEFLVKARTHKPLSLPFPMIGTTVPLAWNTGRYLSVPLAGNTRGHRDEVIEFLESLLPGRGYAVVEVNEQTGLALVCEFVRVLQ